jgi:PAS domain S-box-containing protein
LNKERFNDLRRKAEEHLAAKENLIESLEQTILKKRAHEISVYQVELEIQNEELLSTRANVEEARDRYLDLFEFAPMGYFTLDEHNRIVEVNLTGCQLLKVEKNNIMKTIFTKFLHTTASDQFYLYRKKVLESGTPQTAELLMLKADGTPFYAQLESVRSREESIRLAVMDITKRKKTEEMLAQQTIALEAANEELGAFSYSVSHDLRAPLRSLEAFNDAVIEEYGDKLDETGKDYLNRIRKASQTMSQLIDGMLKLSRIARAEMFKEKVDLSDLAQSIVDELKMTQADRRAEFHIAPDIVVKGDKQLLQIFLNNLLQNAWKFTGKSPMARIELGITEKNGEKVYFIKDNGVGFNMQYVDKLFQPFQRLHSNEEFPGTGIGLTIAQRVVRRHGGRIWAESEIGKGAAFYFTLS